MKNQGFTLVEVLITIGIIGVVSAITIPTLIHNTKAKELQTQLKHVNSVLQNGFGRMVADEIDVSNVLYNADYTTIQKYFKADRSCNKDMPSSFSAAGYKTYYGSAYGAAAQAWYYPPVCLVNGATLLIGIYKTQYESGYWFDSDYSMIMVDINGYNKKPNRFAYDIFFWIFNSDTNRIMPFSTTTSTFLSNYISTIYRCPQYSNSNSHNGEAGIGCTLYALTDPSYFKNLKY